MHELDAVHKKSKLPDKPDVDAVSRMLVDMMMEGMSW